MPAPATTGKAVTLFLGGIITVAIATALLLPGRQTVGAVNAAGRAGSNLLGTAIGNKG